MKYEPESVPELRAQLQTLDAAHKMPAQLGLSPAERERRAEQGVGWGVGTVVMPGTPGNARPAWMGRSQ